MSKYNLKDLLIEGMSDKEFADAKEADRLEAHPEKDTIAKIKAMMAKEKSMKENYQMDGETYDRIDGVIHNGLKRKFLFAFEDLYDDMVESGDEFDKEDVLDYLAICLDKHSRGMNEGAKYYEDDNRKDSPVEKETEKMRMKESSVDETEFDFFTAILDGRYKEEDIEDYLKSDDYQAAQDEFKLDDTYTSDWVQEFANYFESRMDEGEKDINMSSKDGYIAFIDNEDILGTYGLEDAEEMARELAMNHHDAGQDQDNFVKSFMAAYKEGGYMDEGLKEHFQRFLKDYQ